MILGASLTDTDNGLDKLAFEEVITHCQKKTQELEPNKHDPKLGLLKRWFDLKKSDNFAITLPPEIAAHLNKIHDAIQNNNIELWNLNLAALIQKFLLDDNFRLKKELIDAIGSEKIAIARETSRKLQHSSTVVENALCQAYLFMIVQYLELPSSKIDVSLLKQMYQHFDQINFTSRDYLDTQRKKILLNNLLLDRQNAEHLTYWQSQTFDFLLFNGGKSVFLNGEKYVVPTKVYEMMNVSRQLSYPMFLRELDCARHKSLLFSNPLSFTARQEATKKLYEHPSLESLKLKMGSL